MRARWMLFLPLCLLLAAPARASGGQFIMLFGGYADNDEATGTEDNIVYGIRWGGETPVIGVQASVEFNRDGDMQADSLLFSSLLNFYSRDARTRRGKIIFNRFSAFGTLGFGALRFVDPQADDDILFAYEYGIGMQYRFHPHVGVRVQAYNLRTVAQNLSFLEATTGLAFHW